MQRPVIFHHIIDAVRDQSSISLADEIVIIHNQSLLTICHTGTMKIAQ